MIGAAGASAIFVDPSELEFHGSIGNEVYPQNARERIDGIDAPRGVFSVFVYSESSRAKSLTLRSNLKSQVNQ